MKIILFLSPFNAKSVKINYTAPDGTKIKGIQTNDAPVKYLLNSFDVSEIICITTKKAKKSSLKHFKKIVKSYGKIKINVISYDNKKEFSKKTLSYILDCIKDEDEILMDCTGGFRNDIMHLLLINQILTCKNIPMRKVVYSNYSLRKIEELDSTTHLFSLVTGMQEFISTGSTKTIWSYYNNLQTRDKKIEKMLTAVDSLLDAICLCSVDIIDQKVDEFNKVLAKSEKSNNVLFNNLISVFRDRFGEKMDLISLIEWCINSSMLQQAITIYNEKIPKYLFDNNIIESSNSDFNNHKTYEDKSYAMFMYDFFELSVKSSEHISSDEYASFKKYVVDNANAIEFSVLKYKDFECNDKKFKTGIDNIILFLRFSYGNNSHRYNSNWYKYLAEDKKYLEPLKDELKGTIPNTILGMIKTIASFKTDSIDILLENEKVEIKEKISHKVDTIENLELLLPESNYKVRSDIDDMKNFCRDYLYIKTLRNMTNHALSEEFESTEMKYLETKGYKAISEIITTKNLTKILKSAIENIRKL